MYVRCNVTVKSILIDRLLCHCIRRHMRRVVWTKYEFSQIKYVAQTNAPSLMHGAFVCALDVQHILQNTIAVKCCNAMCSATCSCGGAHLQRLLYLIVTFSVNFKCVEDSFRLAHVYWQLLGNAN